MSPKYSSTTSSNEMLSVPVVFCDFSIVSEWSFAALDLSACYSAIIKELCSEMRRKISGSMDIWRNHITIGSVFMGYGEVWRDEVTLSRKNIDF